MAKGHVSIGCEGTGIGAGGRHFAQHSHDHHDDNAGGQVGEDDGRTGSFNTNAGSEEDSGANRGPQSHHREVADFQAMPKLRSVGASSGSR